MRIFPPVQIINIIMKRIFITTVFLYGMLALCYNVSAQDTLMLFNGKSLEGWSETPFPGQGRVNVRDGAVVLGKGKKLTGINYDIIDNLTWDNYEITLEAMRVEGKDFFCALTFPVKGSFCTLVLGGWSGSVIGLSSIDGYDAANNFTGDSRNFENNIWYSVRLRVADDKIEAWLGNIDKMVDFKIGNYSLSLRDEVILSAPLGIATYETTGTVRNIKLIKF